MTPLDNPAWHALSGPQAAFALGAGAARRFHPDVGVFAAMPDALTGGAWDDLATLLDGAPACIFRTDRPEAPAGWRVVEVLPGHQMVAGGPIGTTEDGFVPLGAPDAPEMLALTGRTRPGPFFARTVELGGYLGLRDDRGELVAMAGERLRFPGHTEISAVCTDEPVRRRGLAGRLVRAVAARIEARGETPMLHLSATNTAARALYEALGFTVRADVDFVILFPPERPGPVPGSPRERL